MPVNRSLIRQLQDALPGRPHSWALLIIIMVMSGVAGALGAIYCNHQNASARSLDYLLTRMTDLTARCKNLPRYMIVQRIESRTGRQWQNMTPFDRLNGIDYLVDRVDTANCIRRGINAE